MVLIGFGGFVCSERMFLGEVFVRLIRCAVLAYGLSIFKWTNLYLTEQRGRGLIKNSIYATSEDIPTVINLKC